MKMDACCSALLEPVSKEIRDSKPQILLIMENDGQHSSK